MRVFLALVFAILLPCFGAAQELQPLPLLQQRVTDQTATLSAADVVALEAKLEGFEAISGSQIAVLIVPTTQPEDIAAYAIRVAEAWKIGRTKIDDGIIVVIAKNDRKMRIEVGYGLEGAVPDALAFRIIDETLKPAFREGHFYEGIDKATDQLIGLIKGEALPAPVQKQEGGDGDFFWVVVMIAYFIASIFSRQKRYGISGAVAGLGGVVAGLLYPSLLIGILAALGIFFLGLLPAGAGRGFYTGGGRSGGGFSSGGFSGGGGSFGGGGASGSW
jgi:uncharacterized protein